MEVASHVQKHTSSRGVTSSRAWKATARRVRALCFASGRKTLATSKQGQSAARKPLSRPAQCWRAYQNTSNARARRERRAESTRCVGRRPTAQGLCCFAFAAPRAARAPTPLGRLNKP